jgi:hypothetical protein
MFIGAKVVILKKWASFPVVYELACMEGSITSKTNSRKTSAEKTSSFPQIISDEDV